MSKKFPELVLAAMLLAASPAFATEIPKQTDAKTLIESVKPAEKKAVPKASPTEIREWVNTGKAFFNGGLMGRRDYGKALSFFRKAAEQGDPEGLYMLGTMTYEGKGVAANEKEAFRLYEEAAEKGHTDSQMLTGTQHMYLAMRQPPESKAREEEYRKAAEWFKKAGEKKQPEAMLWYGDMQLRGLGGIAKNEKAGLARIEEAATLHNANAMAVLGGYYLEGKVVNRDYRKAYKYLLLSQRNGNQNARLGVKMVEDKLSEGERKAVREEVTQWEAKHPAPLRLVND